MFLNGLEDIILRRRHKGIKMEEQTELEKQNIIVCAWRLDTEISAERYVDALDDLIALAKKEAIDNRDRIHKINLECARQGAKKEFFDDIEKYRVKTGCILINQSAYWILKAKHLNTNNTDKEKEA